MRRKDDPREGVSRNFADTNLVTRLDARQDLFTILTSTAVRTTGSLRDWVEWQSGLDCYEAHQSR